MKLEVYCVAQKFFGKSGIRSSTGKPVSKGCRIFVENVRVVGGFVVTQDGVKIINVLLEWLSGLVCGQNTGSRLGELFRKTSINKFMLIRLAMFIIIDAPIYDTLPPKCITVFRISECRGPDGARGRIQELLVSPKTLKQLQKK